MPLSQAELAEFLAPPRLAHFATVSRDGRPRVRPLWYAYEDAAFFFTTRLEARYTGADLAQPATAFSLGVALGAAPGPVQVLLLGEAARGGIRRGLSAMAGANATFGVLVFILAAGLSFAEPSGAVLRAIRLAGGAVLMFLAATSFLESIRASAEEPPVPPRLPPFARGELAVLVNPAACSSSASCSPPASLRSEGGSCSRA